MTPREELIWDFDVCFGDAGYHNNKLGPSTDETSSVLKYYAIGKWVPVEERLPEFELGFFIGYVIRRGCSLCENSTPESTVIPDWRFADGQISHWLEIDMPEKIS